MPQKLRKHLFKKHHHQLEWPSTAWETKALRAGDARVADRIEGGMEMVHGNTSLHVPSRLNSANKMIVKKR